MLKSNKIYVMLCYVMKNIGCVTDVIEISC